MEKTKKKWVVKIFDHLSFGLYILIGVGILCVINWFVHRHNQQFDLTPSGQYSLSLQTQKVLASLEQDVNIFIFDRDEMLPRHRDLINSYKILSRKLNVKLVNPDKQPSLARQLEIKRYGTLIVQIGDRKQESQDISEETITNTLIQILKGEERNIYFLQNHGEKNIEDTEREGYSQVKELLGQGNYQVKTLSLMQESSVPDDCTILVIAGPKNDLLPSEIENIRTYIQNGGSGIFLMDINRTPQLTALLSSWNVTVGNNLVVDPNPIAQLFGADELMPLVSSYDSHVIVDDLKNIATIFPETRALDIKSGNESSSNVQSLFKSSSQSWATTKHRLGKPLKYQKGLDARGPFTLGVAGTTGAIQSKSPDQTTGVNNTPPLKNEKGRFVVVGTSRFAINAVISFNGNADLFLNMVNWLSEDEDLISIRPKTPESQQLNLTQAQMSKIRFFALLLIPLLILSIGFSVWWGRR